MSASTQLVLTLSAVIAVWSLGHVGGNVAGKHHENTTSSYCLFALVFCTVSELVCGLAGHFAGMIPCALAGVFLAGMSLGARDRTEYHPVFDRALVSGNLIAAILVGLAVHSKLRF
jgi:hypothetical protein